MSEQKGVLLVTQGFPFGESERSFLGEEFAQLQSCFKTTVLAYGKNDELLYPAPEKVPLYRYEFAGIQPFSLHRQFIRPEVRSDIRAACKTGSTKSRMIRFGKILSYSLRAEQLEAQMREIVEEENIEIIYTYWCTQATITALRLKKKFPRLKVVTRLQGYDLYIERTEMAWQVMRGFVAQRCDRLFFVCDAGREYFCEHWPMVELHKCTVAYLGTRALQVDRWDTLDKNRLAIISCSNIIPLKRVALIAEALAVLPEEIQVTWNHIGDGELYNSTIEYTTRLLRTKSNIQWKFWGRIANNKLEEIYNRVEPQLFITTSSSEGLPVSIQEAFSIGIPAIGTAVGGNSELIQNGVTGFLLAPDPSPQEVADQIVRFYKLSFEQKADMQNAVKKLWQEKCNSKKNADILMKILKKL